MTITIIQTFYLISSPPNPYTMEQKYAYTSSLKGLNKVTIQVHGKFLQDTVQMEVLISKKLVFINIIVQWNMEIQSVSALI